LRSKTLPLLFLPLIVAGAVLYYYNNLRLDRRAPRGMDAARSAVVSSSRDQELQKFSLSGFDDTGKSNWKLEGESAKIDPGQTIFLNENVTLRLRDNTIIRTDHVQWSQDGGTMRTDAIVTVEHENATVRGRGAYGKPNEGFIQLNRDIEMVINQATRLVCAGPMKIYYKENNMTFYRKVKVTDTRGTLSSNRMDVSFDSETRKIKEITAIGNVVIERGQDISKSKRAIYSVDTGSVRLEGSPEITLREKSGGLIDGALGN